MYLSAALCCSAAPINYLHLHVVTALTFAKECQQKRKHKQGAVSIDSSIFFQGFLHVILVFT